MTSIADDFDPRTRAAPLVVAQNLPESLRDILIGVNSTRIKVVCEASIKWELIDSLTALRMLPKSHQGIVTDPNQIIAAKAIIGETNLDTLAPIDIEVGDSVLVFAQLSVDSSGIIQPAIRTLKLFTLHDGKLVNFMSTPPYLKIVRRGNNSLIPEVDEVSPLLLKILDLLNDPKNRTYVELTKGFMTLNGGKATENDPLLISFKEIKLNGFIPFIRLPSDEAYRIRRLTSGEELDGDIRKISDLLGDKEEKNPFRDKHLFPGQKIGEHDLLAEPDPEMIPPKLLPLDNLKKSIQLLDKLDLFYAHTTVRVYGKVLINDEELNVRMQIPVNNRPNKEDKAEIRIARPGATYPMLRVRGDEAWGALIRLGIIDRLGLNYFIDKDYPNAPTTPRLRLVVNDGV